MAIKKKSNTNKISQISKSILFWLAFFTVITLLFIINVPKITQTWEKVFGKQDQQSLNQTETTETVEAAPPAVSLPPVERADFPSVSGLEPPLTEQTAQEDLQSAPPVSEAVGENDTAAAQSAVDEAAQITALLPKENDAPQDFRERSIYLVRVDATGIVFLFDVKRKIPANKSPLVTTLNVLLNGPTAEEKRMGLTSLVPDGTRILGASIERNTATINFNESFMFNTYGAEGYIAQLKQIIWTATEFPNISEVQIQINGKKIEYLDDSIRLDRPRSRDSF
ncbi:MAG: GerMN domain-containing protein [Spirochaetaceae bacterium]|jgi:spore germination protein GerM|nr:GerMN domain-containing protein [Spirochaetaceae bacterium]